MNNPEAVLKAQRSLSIASGGKKVALGLAVVWALLCIAEFALDGEARAKPLKHVASLASIVTVAALFYTVCSQRERELKAELDDKTA